ncbi:MAG: hypothetical protein IAG10_12320 [Planctomycetaceae bacterium]|nr:hypothetical protein [Planctomycetaceae bacterium]
MDDPPDDSHPNENRDVLFQLAYGGMPRFFLYGIVPFFVLAAVFFFVNADFFKGGFAIKGVQLSPERVAFVVCPAMLLMCAVVLVLEVYRRFHPQRIVITEDGLFLPKGRFTDEIIDIRWNDLKATIVSKGSIYEIYEVMCLDGLHGTKTRITSVLFPDFDDFATFALILGKQMGEDWSIKGFLPGAIRGNQKQAQLTSDRIRFREDT